ncbi:MAG: hypothetical protein F6K30_01970, partial [Cyanothece sp. SIO2G6]|nr:hypothetical protein [Cyanothece sp. SIO2G6]
MTIQVISPDDKVVGQASPQFGLDLLLKARSPLSSATTTGINTYLQSLRDNAATALERYTFPTTRDEEWRFTNLAPMMELDWSAPVGEEPVGDEPVGDEPVVTAADLQAYHLSDVGSLLVLVNGEYRADLSTGAAASGITVGALSDPDVAIAVGPKLQQYLGQQRGLEQTFTTLNTASMTDGVVVWVDKGAVAPQPIHLLYVSTMGATPNLSHPRCLVVASATT